MSLPALVFDKIRDLSHHCLGDVSHGGIEDMLYTYAIQIEHPRATEKSERFPVNEPPEAASERLF